MSEPSLTQNLDAFNTMDSVGVEFSDQHKEADNIEKKIYSGFRGYTLLVYWEMLAAVLSLAFYICIHVSALEIVLTSVGSIIMITSCSFALLAKMNLDARKQYIAFILFSLSTLLSTISAVLSLIYIKQNPDEGEDDMGQLPADPNSPDNANQVAVTDFKTVMAIIMIPLQLVIGAGLIWFARSLGKLMKRRDQILQDISVKRMF